MSHRCGLLVLLFLFCLPFSGCRSGDRETAPPSPREKEPNNSMSAANPILLGQTVEGFVNPPSGEAPDPDYFKVVVPGREAVNARIELSGVPGINLFFRLYGADMKEILFVNDAGEGEGETLPGYALAPGTYYVRVAEDRWPKNAPLHSDLEHPYKLVLLPSPPSDGDEREPNDKASLATPLKPGVPMRAFTSPKGDADWFKADLSGAKGPEVLDITVSPVEGLDPIITLCDSLETPLRVVNVGVIGQGERAVNRLLKPEEKVYYIKVNDRAPIRSDPQHPYTLTLEARPPSPEMETEPNEKAPNAVALAPGRPVKGYIDYVGDVDLYRLETEGRAGQLARIELSGIPRTDLNLAILDKDSHLLAESDDGGPDEGERIANLGLTGEPLYAKVTVLHGTIAATLPYEISWLAEENPGGKIEAEPDGAVATALPLKPGEEREGYIQPGGDVDFWRLDLSGEKQPRDWRLTLSGIPKVNLSAVVIKVGEGEKLRCDKKPEGEGESCQARLEPAEYLIQVEGASRKEENPRDRYRLKVEPVK